MARGWDSKAVEDQIADAEAQQETRAKPVLTEAELERIARRESLMLSRTRISRTLEATRDPRHRAQLELALAHLDGELRVIDAADS